MIEKAQIVFHEADEPKLVADFLHAEVLAGEDDAEADPRKTRKVLPVGDPISSLSANAVFLSYASQDAEAARRVCEALRGAGVEVWVDQSELRGGEAWDVSIRRQIRSCRLFLPIISFNTRAREQGYFRREWNLAVSRTRDMAEDAAFLLPVVIDSTHDANSRVPEKFREVQWTRLPRGETPASFVERVRGLVSKNTEQLSSAPVGTSPQITVTTDANRSERRPAPMHPYPGRFFILGGGWTDPSYAFDDSFTQPALDRSESNGFRCIKLIGEDSAMNALTQPLSRDFRDYAKEKPVSDAAFASFSRQFGYDKTPLRATIEKTMDSEAWKADVVSIDAGYNNERLLLYVFLPTTYSSPLQPVVFFPGSTGMHESKFEPSLINSRLLFITKSGRALIFPIYKGTYERQDDLKSDLQEETVRYKDHVIMWGKEYSKTIDYLETRKDMQADKVAYLGNGWGGFMGGIILAVEKRIKVVVLNVGGMAMETALSEADQINYLPRVTQPVLMLNGKYDMFFPVETAQKPMFCFLGTPEDRKKMVVYDSGHVVPPTEFIKETLSWFDTYLGPTR